jgi:hypothetical protein
VTDAATTIDTTTSQSEPTGAPPAAEAAAPIEGAASEATVDAGEADTSVLGGEVKDEAAADDVASEEEVTGPPEKYELALEGFTIDTDLAEIADPVFREVGLSNEQANKLLPIVPKVIEKAQNAAVQQLIDAGAQQRKDWLDAFTADPEIGGAKREETEHLAARGLEAMGFAADHPFRKALTESGFGNHPDMIRMARRLGELVSEDGSFIRSNAGAASVDPLAEMYPNNRRSK